LPEERIAFMSDLLFVKTHPYLASGSPKKWKQSLAEVGGLGVKVAVPGHGALGGSADFSAMLGYIKSLKGIAANMVKSGKPVEQASSEPVPSPFDAWLCFEDFFASNLRFLYKLAKRKAKRQGKSGKV
jgi:glyoxylase-like metal-dependent hydrolase (beta-lactamase superfamily II)